MAKYIIKCMLLRRKEKGTASIHLCANTFKMILDKPEKKAILSNTTGNLASRYGKSTPRIKLPQAGDGHYFIQNLFEIMYEMLEISIYLY